MIMIIITILLPYTRRKYKNVLIRNSSEFGFEYRSEAKLIRKPERHSSSNILKNKGGTAQPFEFESAEINAGAQQFEFEHCIK